MAKEAYINQNDCVGCELCTKICIAFKIAANGKAEFCPEVIAKENEIQDAIDNCPVQCIHWK